MPKELKTYLHTIDNLMDDDYMAYLDEASGEEIIVWKDDAFHALSLLSDSEMLAQF